MFCILYFTFFLLGSCIGSFLNSVIYSLETGKSVFNRRSHCPFCKHKLGFFDLIPILSFIFLRGRCRYCNKKISWQYPIVEITTGLLFALVALCGYSYLYLAYYLLLSAALLLIFIYDLKHYIIPDEIVYSAIFLAIGLRAYEFFMAYGWQFASWQAVLPNLFLGVLAPTLFFAAIYFFSKSKWLGFGDVKLVFLLGLFLGFPNIIVAIFSATLIGSLVGIGLVLFASKGWKSRLPFAPFLITGTFIAFFFGQRIIEAYLGLLVI